MGLNLYRRHRRDCKASHPEEHHSGEFEERKKSWRRCDCPIFASGTFNKRYRRQSTGQWEWDAAKAIASQWEASAGWGETPALTVVAPAPEETGRVRISDATEAYLVRCRNRGIQEPTLKKYQTLVKQLRAYCDSRGYVLVEQLTITDMDRFYASWKDGKRSKAKKLERLKSFVQFCLKREWLSKNITDDLEAPEGSSIPANKTPFTDRELGRIYAACDRIGTKPPGPGYREWSGEDVKDFIMLSVYTGLRISDVATFDIAKRLKGNDVFLRMHKTKKELYTWIPDWLVARLRDREARYGAVIFRCGESTVPRTMAELWRVKLKKVFKIAGEFDEPPTPHKFRYTFVRILLQNGVPISDVAELIGDTPDIVIKFYAKWIPERQDRLRRILQDAFAGCGSVSAELSS